MTLRTKLNEIITPFIGHFLWRNKMRSSAFRESYYPENLKHPDPRPKVLVIHGLTSDSRSTTVDYVEAFATKLAGVDIYMVNLLGVFPSFVQESIFDLVIVTTEALSYRSSKFWRLLEKRLIKVSSRSKQTVIFPQDDYTYSSRLDALCIKAKVDAIYTPFTRDLHLMYPQALRKGIPFIEALTGYVSTDKFENRIIYSKPIESRSIDVGQRVRKLPPEFGSIGIRKHQIAEQFSKYASENGFSVDFSSEPEDVLLGEDWFQFLGNTKFTVSSRGGSSVVDPKNHLANSQYVLRKLFPKFDKELIFKIASFPHIKEGRFDVVSPRLFEAAYMGVCQILIEDDYLGMEPWVHYIPLKSDFSNLSEIYEVMQDKNKIESIVQKAYEYLISSGNFTFSKFIEDFQTKQLNSPKGRSYNSTVTDIDELVGLSGFHSVRSSIVPYIKARDRHEISAINEAKVELFVLEYIYSLITRKDRKSYPELLEVPWASYFSKVNEKANIGKQ